MENSGIVWHFRRLKRLDAAILLIICVSEVLDRISSQYFCLRPFPSRIQSSQCNLHVIPARFARTIKTLQAAVYKLCEFKAG